MSGAAVLLCAACLLASAPPAAVRPAATIAAPKHVLVLTYLRRGATLAAVDDTYRRVLSDALGDRLDYYTESIDGARLADPVYQQALRAYLQARYAPLHFDLLIATSPAVITFLDHARDLFPGAPRVFNGPDADGEASGAGEVSHPDFGKTIGAALQAQPLTKQIVLVSGLAPAESRYHAAAWAACLAAAGPITCRDLVGLAPADLEDAIRRLPADAIVLYVNVSSDAVGGQYAALDVLDRLAAATPVPIYGWHESMLGHGIVGGYLFSSVALARETAEMAVRILNGDRGGAAPSRHGDPNAFEFDARQLVRYHIATALLPPASRVLFGQPSIWAARRGTLALVASIVALQLVLVSALLVQQRSRRQAERALHTTEVRTSAILRVLPDLMFVFDRDLVYVDYYARDPRVLFAPPDQFLGRTIAQIMPPELARRFESLLHAAFESDEPVSMEYTLPLEDGDRLFECRTVRAEQNTVIAIVRDLTERQRAEEKLQLVQGELAHALRVRSLGELAAGIAHEVNQPLSAMVANAQAGLRLLGAPPASGPETIRTVLKDVLKDVVADGNRASGIISRIRDNVNRAPLVRVPLSVNDIIDEVVALSGRTLGTRHVTMDVDKAPDLAHVTADRIQLQQVLLNLVLNAADALQPLPPRNRRLRIRSSQRGDTVAVAVEDSGPGLPDDSPGLTFTPFFTTKPNGMGLGLTISRSIVEAHGGRLALIRNSPYGATFEFELPVTGSTTASRLIPESS